MKKFSPSSAGFLVDGTAITKYNSGCLRSILIGSNGVRGSKIPEQYARVGAAHEAQFLVQLLRDKKNTSVIAEHVIKRQLTPEVEYSGRSDFKVVREGLDEPIIYETKGTISKNTRRDFRKGEWNVSYLAQLCSYMVQMRTTKGKLVCGYYEENEECELVLQEERAFKVVFSETGHIEVDDEPSGYTVMDLLAHQNAAVQVLTKQEIASRPDKWNQTYGGPCTRCMFKRTCDLYDSGALPAEQFIDSARQDAETDKATVRDEPVPFKVKVKKVPKPLVRKKK